MAGAVGEAHGVVAGGQVGEVQCAAARRLSVPLRSLNRAALEVHDGDVQVEHIGAQVKVELVKSCIWVSPTTLVKDSCLSCEGASTPDLASIIVSSGASIID